MSSKHVRGTILRIARAVLLVGAVLLGGALVVGSIYQALGVRTDRAQYPPPGELVDLGSHRMHISCGGSGAATVLLDSGAGGWSMHWFAIRPYLESHARVCAFDRSGLGWSEEGPGAYDGEAIARELHVLLEEAEVPRPLIYVGHSLGANIAQIYYGLFPEDVAGMVLIDPGRPEDLLEDFEGTREEALAIDRCGWRCGLGSFATRVGAVRFFNRNAGRRTLGEERQAEFHAGISRQSNLRTVLAYLAYLPKTAYQNLAAEGFDDVLLTLLSSDDNRAPEGEETEEDVRLWYQAVQRHLADLASQSTRGRGPIVVEGATHQSIVTDEQHVQPVVEEILRIVNESQS